MKKSFLKRKKTYRKVGTLAFLLIIALLTWPLIKPLFQKAKRGAEIGIAETPVIKKTPNPVMLKVIQEYENEILDLLDKTNAPGAAIAIVQDSTVLLCKGYGVKTAGTKDSVNIHTAFRIASVSKCFASFLTATLVEQGKLNWDDRVVDYLPDFQLKSAEQTQALTLKHVLSHTTGLPYHTYTNLVEEGIDLKTLLERLKEVKVGKVGVEYSYQNVAYSLIGEVIAAATGKSYEQNMQEIVFNPLGMKDASMNYKSFVDNPNIAKPHRIMKRRWSISRINDTYYNVSPAGGINASISDMAEWMKALLGHRAKVIHQYTLEHLFSPVIPARSKNRHYYSLEKGGKGYYGLGWRILHFPSDTLIYHGGYVTGYRSEVGLMPNKDIAVCILANAPGQLPDTAIPLFFSIYKKYSSQIADWENKQKIASTPYED